MDTKPVDIKKEDTNAEAPPVNTRYWIAGAVIIVILLIAGVGYKLTKNRSSQQMASAPANYTNSATNNAVVTTTPSSAVNSGAMQVNKTGTSNAQLDQDLQNIQGNMNQLKADQGNANQSVQTQSTDTPQ